MSGCAGQKGARDHLLLDLLGTFEDVVDPERPFVESVLVP
jgi:hypothetical protein